MKTKKEKKRGWLRIAFRFLDDAGKEIRAQREIQMPPKGERVGKRKTLYIDVVKMIADK